MAIYIYNGPLVIPSGGGEKGFSLSIDGGTHRDGKKVTSFNSLTSSVSWLTNFTYEESGTEGDGWYYYFYVTAARNATAIHRSGNLTINYTLEDGTVNEETFKVFQNGDNSIIDVDCNNPLTFDTFDCNKTTTIQATFRDVTNVSEINEFQLTGSSWFNVVNSNGGSNGMGYSMDYEITPKAYNPFSLEIEGQLKLTSSNSEYIVHLSQKGCQQPYGIMPFDSTEMPYCSSSNNIKRFYVDKNAQRIMFKCNYPFADMATLSRSYDSEFATTFFETQKMTDTAYSGYTDTIYIDLQENTDNKSRTMEYSCNYKIKNTTNLYASDKIIIEQNWDVSEDEDEELEGGTTGGEITAEGKIGAFITKGNIDADTTSTGISIESLRCGYSALTISTPTVDVDWIHLGTGSKVEGVFYGYDTVMEYPISFDVNNGAERVGTITFEGTNAAGKVLSSTTVITQYAAEEVEKPYITIQPSRFNFAATNTGSNLIIDVDTNGSVSFSENYDWFYIWTNEEYKDKRYFITCNTNTGKARTGVVVFTATLGDLTATANLTVSQEGTTETIDPVISANVNYLNFKWDGTAETTDYIDVVWIGDYASRSTRVDGGWIYPSTGVFIESASTTNKTYRYKIGINTNNTTKERSGTITFMGTTTNGENASFVLTIQQEAKTESEQIPVAGDEYCGPIWKDVEYEFGSIDMVEYGIYTVTKVRLPGNAGLVDVDTLLFAGRSYSKPNDGSNKILVNKICQTYMEAPLLSKDATAVGGGYGLFKLKSLDGETTYRTYRFVNDWTYSEDFRTGLLSRPILNNDNKVYKNQMLPFTVFAAADKITVEYGITYNNGTPTWNNTIYLTNDLETEMFPYTGRTAGASGYFIGNKVYNVVNDCNVQYVLYYVNPWGGYDWFPIRGKVDEKDSMTQMTSLQNYNNQTWQFGKKRYLTEINKKFTLHTQWLTEDESSRMWYLLQSNVVYLHNLKENKIHPVIITNTEQEHKKKLIGSRISYAIEVELSQTRQRI